MTRYYLDLPEETIQQLFPLAARERRSPKQQMEYILIQAIAQMHQQFAALSPHRSFMQTPPVSRMPHAGPVEVSESKGRVAEDVP